MAVPEKYWLCLQNKLNFSKGKLRRGGRSKPLLALKLFIIVWYKRFSSKKEKEQLFSFKRLVIDRINKSQSISGPVLPNRVRQLMRLRTKTFLRLCVAAIMWRLFRTENQNKFIYFFVSFNKMQFTYLFYMVVCTQLLKETY